MWRKKRNGQERYQNTICGGKKEWTRTLSKYYIAYATQNTIAYATQNTTGHIVHA